MDLERDEQNFGGDTSGLLLAEAVALAHVVASEAASRTGSRALFVKGLALSRHGLRQPRVSVDVDMLVYPDDFDVVCEQLAQWGWRARSPRVSGRPVAQHSVTYSHPAWPCDIDVHLWFPGFLAPRGEVFDVLWARRLEVKVAERLVCVTDLLGSVLVMALHSLRSTPDNPRHAAELCRLIAIVETWDVTRRGQLMELSAATGSARSLERFWYALGVDVHADHPQVADSDLRKWRRRQDGRSVDSVLWLGHILSGGPRGVLGRTRDAVWMPEDALRASRPVSPGAFGLNWARTKRLVRGIVRLPLGVARSALGGKNVARDLGLIEPSEQGPNNGVS